MLPLPEGHRFPVTKYALLRQRVEAAGLVRPDELIAAPAATDEDITRRTPPNICAVCKTAN